MLAVLILLGLGYTEQQKGNVKVGLFLEKFPRGFQAATDIITTLLSLVHRLRSGPAGLADRRQRNHRFLHAQNTANPLSTAGQHRRFSVGYLNWSSI